MEAGMSGSPQSIQVLPTLALGRKSAAGVQLLGTAFEVAPGRFATTGHVTGADDRDLVLLMPRYRSIEEYQDTGDPTVRWVDASIGAYDPLRDLCIVDAVPLSLGGTFSLGTTDDIVPGDRVVILGFPHADQGRLVLTRHDTQVGARILVAASGVKSKHIVLNTQARPGQSGSPVVKTATSAICAVLIGSYAPGGGGGISLGGVDPHTLHQTTYAVSAEYVRAML
jgi:hypothetical protein